MIAGASWTWWIGFHAAVVTLLAVDGFLPGRRKGSQSSPLISWLWTAALAVAALVFALWLNWGQGHQRALEFLAGYTIEISLSIDNLFVFLVIFQGLKVNHVQQHKALLWGIAGAIVMRAVFIAAGVALIHRFEWVTWIFGAFLLFAAWKLVRGGSAHAAIPAWIRNMQPKGGSLLPVILAVEVTDLIFAVDSIPAVLAVSRDPFVVYTSNIAAILGLRSLYFALADLLERFKYLHYGLGVLLAFVAVKMMVAHWIEIPIALSLGIIGAIIGVCIGASWIVAGRGAKGAESAPSHQD